MEPPRAIIFQTIWHNIPEDSYFHTHCCENLKYNFEGMYHLHLLGRSQSYKDVVVYTVYTGEEDGQYERRKPEEAVKKTIFKELMIIKGRIRPGRNMHLILGQNLLMFLQGSADRLPPHASTTTT
jgi:hypothetical protein